MRAEELLDELNATLIGGGGESELMENALRHIVSRLSDEGVIVELFDLPGSPLFERDGRATPLLKLLIGRVVKVASVAQNLIAIEAHVRTEPVASDLLSVRNNRVEIIFLLEDK